MIFSKIIKITPIASQGVQARVTAGVTTPATWRCHLLIEPVRVADAVSSPPPSLRRVRGTRKIRIGIEVSTRLGQNSASQHPAVMLAVAGKQHRWCFWLLASQTPDTRHAPN